MMTSEASAQRGAGRSPSGAGAVPRAAARLLGVAAKACAARAVRRSREPGPSLGRSRSEYHHVEQPDPASQLRGSPLPSPCEHRRVVRGRIDIVELRKTDVVEVREDFHGAIAIQDQQRRRPWVDDGREMSNAAAARAGAATASAVRDVVLAACQCGRSSSLRQWG